ncbi:MAG TPA: OsmC family protein [Chitinophagaceae bacterium]|nr:OsmC family protein [Chitinophagaceae bacterium]
MASEFFYDVQVKWNNDRKGTLTSAVLDDFIEVATPPEFNKGIAGMWSPEHLLVAAVNSCLMTTFLAIADNSRLPFTSFLSKAKGKLEMVEGKYMISEITLAPEVAVASDEHIEKAARVLQKAEANCLIANSIKAKIIFQPQVVTELPELV